MAYSSASKRARAMADRMNRTAMGNSTVIPTVRSRSSMVLVSNGGSKSFINVRPMRGLNSRHGSSGQG